MGSQNIQANATITVYIRVIDFGSKCNLCEEQGQFDETFIFKKLLQELVKDINRCQMPFLGHALRKKGSNLVLVGPTEGKRI